MDFKFHLRVLVRSITIIFALFVLLAIAAFYPTQLMLIVCFGLVYLCAMLV